LRRKSSNISHEKYIHETNKTIIQSFDRKEIEKRERRESKTDDTRKKKSTIKKNII
jgi:hypothetical protein